MIAHLKKPRPWIAATLLFLPTLAQAHPGSHLSSFSEGSIHPFTGWDHICAMIAVGLWAAQRGGRAIWALPLAFLSMMTAGAVLGLVAGSPAQTETGIITSVLILGLLVATATRLRIWSSAVLAGFLALFHGFAHAAALPAESIRPDFFVGFLLSTAVLHGIGLSAGWLVHRLGQTDWLRYAGGAVALYGVVLFVG